MLAMCSHTQPTRGAPHSKNEQIHQFIDTECQKIKLITASEAVDNAVFSSEICASVDLVNVFLLLLLYLSSVVSSLDGN